MDRIFGGRIYGRRGLSGRPSLWRATGCFPRPSYYIATFRTRREEQPVFPLTLSVSSRLKAVAIAANSPEYAFCSFREPSLQEKVDVLASLFNDA